jgi:hypothetical protein
MSFPSPAGAAEASDDGDLTAFTAVPFAERAPGVFFAEAFLCVDFFMAFAFSDERGKYRCGREGCQGVPGTR